MSSKFESFSGHFFANATGSTGDQDMSVLDVNSGCTWAEYQNQKAEDEKEAKDDVTYTACQVHFQDVVQMDNLIYIATISRRQRACFSGSAYDQLGHTSPDSCGSDKLYFGQWYIIII